MADTLLPYPADRLWRLSPENVVVSGQAGPNLGYLYYIDTTGTRIGISNGGYWLYSPRTFIRVPLAAGSTPPPAGFYPELPPETPYPPPDSTTGGAGSPPPPVDVGCGTCGAKPGTPGGVPVTPPAAPGVTVATAFAVAQGWPWWLWLIIGFALGRTIKDRG